MRQSTAGSGEHAGPLEVAVEMSFAFLVAMLKQPTIAAFGLVRISQQLSSPSQKKKLYVPC